MSGDARASGAHERGSSAPATPRSALRSGRAPLLFGVTGVLTLAGLAVADPAAAIEDTRRPTAEVVQGPSCGRGVVRVEVTNGTAAHRVALVFDGSAEQEVADLPPGAQTELGSADIDWATTVDVSVTVLDADGTVGEPLELGTYTRPAHADCDPTTAPVSPQPAPSSGVLPAASSNGPSSNGSSSNGSSSATGYGQPTAPGGVVTVRGSGFAPGEPVSVTIPGVAGPLATVTAAQDGSMEAVVQIPRETHLGPVTVQLVGHFSLTTTGLDLQVDARQQPPVAAAAAATARPAVAAGTALLLAAGALGVLAGRRPRTAGRHMPARH